MAKQETKLIGTYFGIKNNSNILSYRGNVFFVNQNYGVIDLPSLLIDSSSPLVDEISKSPSQIYELYQEKFAGSCSGVRLNLNILNYNIVQDGVDHFILKFGNEFNPKVSYKLSNYNFEILLNWILHAENL